MPYLKLDRATKETKSKENHEKLVWSNEDTSKMLHYCKEFMFDVGSMKKFKNKKTMWDFIGTKLSRAGWKADGGQFENRYAIRETSND